MATDIDEFYQTEMYHERSRTKYCSQPITERNKMRESWRKKMDVYWMKEKLILDHVQSLREGATINQIISEMEEYDNFLTDYKETSYRHSIKMMHEVKVYYQETDRLRKLHEAIGANIEPLKMKIFFLGVDFVRLTILQNFQYLLKPIEWRIKHDHIHRTSDGKLEDLKDSIMNRETVNLWSRDNVTVYVIKDYIENVYMAKNQSVVPVFDNGKDFLKAVKDLNANSARWLVQFHLAAHTLNEVEKELFMFEQNNGIDKLNRMVKSLSQRRIFMESRSKQIKEIASSIVDQPLEKSFSSEKLHMLRGLCEIMFKTVVLKNSDGSKTQLYSSVEMLAAVEKKVLNLFVIMDQLPHNLTAEIDMKIRKERKKVLRDAMHANKIETSVHLRIAQLARSLAKPPKKEKREGKLPMSKLPTKPPKPKVVKPLLTPIEEAYYRAFTELGPNDDVEFKFDKSIKLWIDRIKNESIPFYLDRYLDVNLGVKLPTATADEGEKIFLEEAAAFKFQEVLPEVRQKVKLLEENQEKLKREHIVKTPYLYQ